jgi:hypothetical protein
VLAGALKESRTDSNDLTFAYTSSAQARRYAAELTVGAKVDVTWKDVTDSTLDPTSVINTGGSAFTGVPASRTLRSNVEP